jgi:hypothetical protein
LPDNPDFFTDIVAANSYVFLEKTVDFDGLERYLLVESSKVNYQFPNLISIELVKEQYLPGQIFYAYQSLEFYELSIDIATQTKILTLITDNTFIARTGRPDLAFQYRHNAPLTSRIDPTATNIIDVYIVTQDYYTTYQAWLKDTTGSIGEPTPPNIDELNTTYQALGNYKMISDQLVLNSVQFKPLFGTKASTDLRATIKVIPAKDSTASESQIKNLVITALNDYFNIDNWNFGDTFYFSELSAYIHANIGSDVSSVVLVPVNPQKSFGDLYEIRSAANEIFVNAATVNDVEVIAALTSTNLRTAPGSGVI